LCNEQGSVLLEVNYSSQAPWPRAVDGAGHSLVLARPSYGEASPRAWGISDAVPLGAQAEGVALGRWPDGASDFYPLAAPTAGAANAHPRVSDIVINELMYHPISNLDDDQFIELYNQGTNAVDIGGWGLRCTTRGCMEVGDWRTLVFYQLGSGRAHRIRSFSSS
jgi:hypothetical protein